MREAEREIKDARFELHEKSSLPPTETPGDNPLVRVIQDAAREMTGQSPRPSGMSGATVAKQLIARGIMAVGFAPGDSDQAHQADESVDIEELVTVRQGHRPRRRAAARNAMNVNRLNGSRHASIIRTGGVS